MKRIINLFACLLLVLSTSFAVVYASGGSEKEIDESSAKYIVRQVHKRVNCMGYYAVIEGTYEVNNSGSIINPDLTVYAESSELRILAFTYQPMGSVIRVAISFDSPNGGASRVLEIN